jgi:hypothetical protein
MRHNGEKRPDEILAEIERRRSDIDDTLQAIERKLTPGQLVDQGLDYLRHSGAREFASNLGNSVKDNPLPVALVGIGLAWLMVGSRADGGAARLPSSRLPERASETADLLGDRAGEATARFGERVGATLDDASDAVSSAREKLGDTVDRASRVARAARDRVTETAGAARERAAELGGAARHQVDRARVGYDRMMREQPLALGAIGLAVGAIIAASVPRTREEDRLMGPARDRLLDEAKDTAKEQLDKATEIAGAAAQAAQKEMQRAPPGASATAASTADASDRSIIRVSG